MYYRFLEDGIVFSFADVTVLAIVASGKLDLMGWTIIVCDAVFEPLSILDRIYVVPVGQARWPLAFFVPPCLFIRFT